VLFRARSQKGSARYGLIAVGGPAILPEYRGRSAPGAGGFIDLCFNGRNRRRGSRASRSPFKTSIAAIIYGYSRDALCGLGCCRGGVLESGWKDPDLITGWTKPEDGCVFRLARRKAGNLGPKTPSR